MSSLLKALKFSNSYDSDLAERILSNYLFPDLSPETAEPINPQMAVLHNETRQKLYNIVNLLCKGSDSNLHQAMDQLRDLVVRGMSDPVWLFQIALLTL